MFPTLTVPKIRFFLTSLKKGNINDLKYRKTLINIFVNKIFLYDDRVTITFNSGDEAVTINDVLLSEIEEKDNQVKNLFLVGDGPPEKLPETMLFLAIFIVFQELFSRNEIWQIYW